MSYKNMSYKNKKRGLQKIQLDPQTLQTSPEVNLLSSVRYNF